MPNLPLELEAQITTFETRPCANINIIEEGGSPWRSFRHDPKVLRPDVADLVEAAFDSGGYVAGGCARWLRSAGTVTPLQRGTYAHEGGDIDLFFHSPQDWRDYVEWVHETERANVTLSPGKLAANIIFKHPPYDGKKPMHGFNLPPVVQTIRCVTGTPEEVIRSFDFVNSMVAFDRERTWVAEDWARFEQEKVLGVAWWGSRSIAYRVKKYLNKYGYVTMENLSSSMFEQLVSATDTMTDRQKEVARALWMNAFEHSTCPLDMKLTILASTVQGIDTQDIFYVSNFKPTPWSGSYEMAIHRLLERQRIAASPNRPPYSDLPGFSAEEYCWAI